MKALSKLWLGIAILAVCSPLGLLLPRVFKAGSAWGEWGTGEMRKLVGYVPQGLEKLSSLWNAPLPNYTFGVPGGKGLSRLSLATILSAAVGIAAVALVAGLIGKMLVKKGD